MGEIIKWILIVSLQVGFWASIVFTFFPILTIIISGIIISLNGTVLMDLYWFVQMWAPFNFNVVLLWTLTIATAFGAWWLASKIFALLRSLIKF